MRSRIFTAFFAFIAGFAAIVSFHDALAGARIYRDKEGVVQIYADNNRDLFYAFGYVIGRDRLFHVEMRKYQAYGRRAELLGRTDTSRWENKFVDKDTDTRLFLNLDDLQQQINKLPSQDLEILRAYADGLNKAIEEALEDNGAKLPAGFAKYNFKPSPWSVLDVVATSADVLAAYSNFADQLDTLALYKYLAEKFPKHCDDILDQLIWLHDPYAIATKNDQKPIHQQSQPAEAKGCRAATGQLPNGLATLGALPTFALQAGDHFEPRRASMAWGVGKDRAVGGVNSIFLSGPQTGWLRPSYYYTVGLHGGDFDFIGMAAEGMPLFEVGFNRHYAWGMTAGLGMQGGVFQLQLNDDHSAYLHNKQWVKLTARPETIRVKNEAAVKDVVKLSRYGPIVSTDEKTHIAFAKGFSWQGYEAASVMAWLRAAAAQSEDAWRARAQSFAFNYNWFYANSDGKVGFAYTGRFPVFAKDVDIRLPIKGNGQLDHRGYLWGQDTPIHLTEKVLYNFNNRPMADWPNSGLYWEQWSRGNQVEILKRVIDNWPEQVTWEDVTKLNVTISSADVNVGMMRGILENAAQGLDQDTLARQAAEAVLKWDGKRDDADGDGDFDDVGLTVFDMWLKKLVPLTLGPVLNDAKKGDTKDIAKYFLEKTHQPLPARLEEHPSGGTLATYRAFLGVSSAPGIPYHYNFFQDRNAYEVARQALLEAVEALKAQYKSERVADWRTKATAQTYFPTNTDRVPMSVVSKSTDVGVYANRGAVNLVVQYNADGGIRAAFANPLGGPEDNKADTPSDFHLDLYAKHQFSSLHLLKEQDLVSKGTELWFKIN